MFLYNKKKVMIVLSKQNAHIFILNTNTNYRTFLRVFVNKK